MSDEPTLRSVLEAVAGDLPGVRSGTNRSDVTSWARGDREFAVLRGDVVELRLDVPIAAAAMKTPDAAASGRGPDWIRFSPPTLDGHAIDRLTAWFALGYRRAGA